MTITIYHLFYCLRQFLLLYRHFSDFKSQRAFSIAGAGYTLHQTEVFSWYFITVKPYI